MKLTPQQYAEALYDAIQQTHAKDHDLVLDNFVKILAQNGDLNRYHQIEDTYHRLENKAKGITEVEVTFAQEHNHKLLDELNEIVKGKKEFKTKMDNNLIGGIVVKVNDELIDASVKTQLNNLNRELKS